MNKREPREEQLWLLLIHQLPSKPAYLRVKIWRRLQGIGAVAVKNTVYALPATAETQEDFEWLLKEIADGGGEAVICEARLIDGLTDEQARGLFDAARDKDYEELTKEARALVADLEAANGRKDPSEASAQVRRIRKRFTEIEAIDFFGASGSLGAGSLLTALEKRFAEEKPTTEDVTRSPQREAISLKKRTWVTRRDVHVDRIACVWLIRRFIDLEATIRFVAGKGYAPKEGELRFDMFEGEFTHEGDHCSFEVLLTRAGLSDPALQAIAEIVHDIDLKDSKFGREETTGIAHLITGIASANVNDEDRTSQGAPVFDSLYQYFRSKPG
jgi:hypothetical protein